MAISNDLKAFLIAFALVTVISLFLVETGTISPERQNAAVAGGLSADPLVLPAASAPAPPAATPVPPPSESITSPVDVPIIMYHQVLPVLPENEFDARLTVTNAALDEQISYLACAGYTPISMKRLFDGFDGVGALPEKPVILTFDDGWADHYTNAFPILLAHGYSASFSIVTGFIDSSDSYMTWGQVAEMYSAGMEMLSHSVSHPDLGAMDDDEVVAQVSASKGELETHLGTSVEYFVYPAGEPFRSGSVERQQQVVQILADAGYRGGLLVGAYDVSQDPARPFALNRIRVDGGEDIYSFAASISGPSPADLTCP